MRNFELEAAICEAIQSHSVIRFYYKDQTYYRTFEPYIIYRSDMGKVLVGGKQRRDDSKPDQPPTPHRFEVALINASSLDTTPYIFDYDTRFDPDRPEYRGRTVCVINPVKASKYRS
jgi:hypothetical protein